MKKIPPAPHNAAVSFSAYYTQNPRINRDFTTAPEISPLFGQLVGLWLLDCWHKLGSPAAVLIAECGPGRGVLLAEGLRAAAKLSPAFGQAAAVHLVEISPTLKAEQAKRLQPYAPCWHETLETLPKTAPLLVVGNEFLDALPPRIFVKTLGGWNLRQPAAHGWAEQPTQKPPFIPAGIKGGDVFEYPAAGLAFMAHLEQRLAAQGGYGLFLDYGPAQPAWGESIQALYQGKPVGVFAHPPGEADVTAHVPFWLYHQQATLSCALTTKGAFIHALGGTALLARAMRRQPQQAQALAQGYQRLTAPSQMGSLFKAFALWPQGQPEPDGFFQPL
jgi:NADH dehydrogenase [ubiquinone] 1 alpha subcomplex assembly factor 7